MIIILNTDLSNNIIFDNSVSLLNQKYFNIDNNNNTISLYSELNYNIF